MIELRKYICEKRLCEAANIYVYKAVTRGLDTHTHILTREKEREREMMMNDIKQNQIFSASAFPQRATAYNNQIIMYARAMCEGLNIHGSISAARRLINEKANWIHSSIYFAACYSDNHSDKKRKIERIRLLHYSINLR
jgi:hypothetical protein